MSSKVLALILFYLLRKLLRNKKIDYSAPTITFLKNAEKRYRFMPFLDVVMTIPLLALLITGGGIIVKVSFTRYFPGSFLPLILNLIFMAGVVAFGFWASYRNWLRDKGEILEEIRKEYAGRLEVVFIDVWQNEDAGKQYGINLIPTQIFFDASGKELFRHEGFFAKEDILAKWKELGVNFAEVKH